MSFSSAKPSISKRSRTRADLNDEFKNLISLVCEAVPDFRAYDVSKIAISIGRSRGQGKTGLWAYVVPLRYSGGRTFRRGQMRGRRGYYSYQSPTLTEAEPQALYLMSFLLPRFFQLSFSERLETLVHELYHLHPSLRGDLRRFPRPHVHHGPTPAAYDEKVRELTAEALKNFPDLARHPLLQSDGRAYQDYRSRRHKLPRRVFVLGEPPLEKGPVEWPALKARTEPVPKPRPQAQPKASAREPERQLALPFLWLLLFALGLVWAVRSTLAAGLPTLGAARKASALYRDPRAGAPQSGHLRQGERVRILRPSSSGQWVEVEGEGGRGWIPRSWILPVKGAATVPPPRAAPGDALTQALNDLPEPSMDEFGLETEPGEAPNQARFDEKDVERSRPADQDLQHYDRQSDKYLIRKKGRLFEQPTKFAVRFAVLEKGDEVRVLRRSPRGQWLLVRLLLTGEEGWYPTSWIELKREERLARWGAVGVEGALHFGNDGRNLGFSGGLFYNLADKGFEGRPRDRLELGLSYLSFQGETVKFSNGASFAAKYNQSALLVRYLSLQDKGDLGGGFELGLLYGQAKIDTTGVDASLLAANAVPQSSNSLGFLAGAIGYYALSENFQSFLGTRLSVAGGTVFSIYAGLGLRF